MLTCLGLGELREELAVTGPPGPLPISLAQYDITWPLLHQHQTLVHGLKLPHATTASTLVAMPSLLLVVFLLQLVLHLINTVGASTIDELVCTSSVYTYATIH